MKDPLLQAGPESWRRNPDGEGQMECWSFKDTDAGAETKGVVRAMVVAGVGPASHVRSGQSSPVPPDEEPPGALPGTACRCGNPEAQAFLGAGSGQKTQSRDSRSLSFSFKLCISQGQFGSLCRLSCNFFPRQLCPV